MNVLYTSHEGYDRAGGCVVMIFKKNVAGATVLMSALFKTNLQISRHQIAIHVFQDQLLVRMRMFFGFRTEDSVDKERHVDSLLRTFD